MPDIVPEQVSGVPEGIEILSYGKDTALSEAVRRAKGKFTLLSEGDAECGPLDELFSETDKTQADLLYFDDGFLIKTSILRDVPSKFIRDTATLLIYAAMEAKTAQKCENSPFKCAKQKYAFSEENAVNLGTAIAEFNKAKAKLSREIYSLCANLICARLEEFYTDALISIKKGLASYERLSDFDDKLRENVVLYLAFQKRFTAADLKKLKEKQYKISFFTYKKLLKN